MNHSIQKLVSDFINKIGPSDIKMLETVSAEAAFNYIFFLYKKIYGDYPTGELYEILKDKFLKRLAA